MQYGFAVALQTKAELTMLSRAYALNQIMACGIHAWDSPTGRATKTVGG